MIEGSIKLQQALFLKAIPGGPLNFSKSGCMSGKWMEGQRAVKNPLLQPLFEWMRQLDTESDFEITFTTREGLADMMAPTAWSVLEASWRKMLPTQPPVQSCFFADVENDYLVFPPWQVPEDAFLMEPVTSALDRLICRARAYGYIGRVVGSRPFNQAQYLEDSHRLRGLIDHERKNPSRSCIQTRPKRHRKSDRESQCGAT